MDMSWVKVPFDKAEMKALISLADAECRIPQEQLRWLLLKEAKRRRLLTNESEKMSEVEYAHAG